MFKAFQEQVSLYCSVLLVELLLLEQNEMFRKWTKLLEVHTPPGLVFAQPCPAEGRGGVGAPAGLQRCQPCKAPTHACAAQLDGVSPGFISVLTELAGTQKVVCPQFWREAMALLLAGA